MLKHFHPLAIYHSMRYPGDIAIQKREIDYIQIKIVLFIINFGGNSGLDPEGLKTWGGGGRGIDYQRHKSSGVSREGAGGYERGASPGFFFLIGLPESAFPCYFQTIFINFADCFFFSVNFRRSWVRKLMGNILLWGHSLPSTNSRRASCQYLAKECALYWSTTYV